MESDAERDAIISGMGLRVLRISNDEVISDLPSSAKDRCVFENHLRPFPKGKGSSRGVFNYIVAVRSGSLPFREGARG